VKDHGLVKPFRLAWHLCGDEHWSAEALSAVALKAARESDHF
jgi:hypothetical protein